MTQINLSRAIDFLLASQAESGGWGYLVGHAPAVEPSAAALLALQAEPAARPAVERAVTWLRQAQNPDGGWGFAPGDEESNWHTAWAVLALRRLPSAQDLARRGLDWLAAVPTSQTSGDDFRNRSQAPPPGDPARLAWPWLPGEATWVEPTSLAVLALADASSLPLVQARLQAALAYFEARRCPGGGWNVGNPVMFDSALPPRAHQTAWALLALQRLSPAAIRPEDLQALRREMRREDTPLALAWGLLALTALGESDQTALSRLGQLQSPQGDWQGNPYQTAVAVLAARGGL